MKLISKIREITILYKFDNKWKAFVLNGDIKIFSNNGRKIDKDALFDYPATMRNTYFEILTFIHNEPKSVINNEAEDKN